MKITLESVFDAVRREEMYARGWGKPRPEAPNKQDHFTSTRTGWPFSLVEWMVFAEKYLNEARLAYANYTPDHRAVAVRMLKAAYLLLAGIEVNLTKQEIGTIGGHSSNKFPILHGGLATFKALVAAPEPAADPTPPAPTGQAGQQ
ncbi:MAG: hypothetical protein MN733_14220 [Nitrososphaera sp.]|nr:hypothetical protein [Nitrososphaera sp.]